MCCHSRQQQICDVCTSNQQHESNGAQQQPESRDNVSIEEIVVESFDARAPALIRFWIGLVNVASDGVHVGVRLRQRYPRLQPCHHEQPVKITVRLFRFEYQRRKNVARHTVGLTWRTHANHGVEFTV